MTTHLRLLLVRHGQVAANREFRYVGSSDEPLTEVGWQQAREVAQSLECVPISALLSSPMRRARQTAGELAALRDVPVQVEERLREQDFGSWEGLSRDEVRRRSDADREWLERWEKDPSIAPPDGESQVSVRERVVDLIDDLGSRPSAVESAPTMVLVSHVGPIKAILAVSLDLPIQQSRRIFLDPGSVSIVDWGTPSVLRMCNARCPIQWTGLRWMKLEV